MGRSGVLPALAVVATQWFWFLVPDAGADEPSAAARCGGRVATIVGTARSEVIHGTAGADVIFAAGGDDTVFGLGGDDRICGGAGSDRLSGGRGNDRLYGGADALRPTDEGTTELTGDILSGDAGNDRLVPGHDTRSADDVSRDVLSWDSATRGVQVDVARGSASGQGTDTFVGHVVAILGSRYDDVLRGSKFADQLHGARGSDRIAGRAGPDDLFADDLSFELKRGGADVVYGGPGIDWINASGGPDRLYGGPGGDTIGDSGDGSDQISGGTGGDLIIDDLSSKPGTERVAGGPGSDRYEIYGNRVNPDADPATATLDLASGDLNFQGPSLTVHSRLTGFENVGLNLWSTSWTITGTSGPDEIGASGTSGTVFHAGGGDDVFTGSYHDDVFDGGPGTDRAVAMGNGDDTCISVEQFDTATTTGQDCEHIS
jgi:Ca2+-binding RTX toxin-like protein